VQTTAQQIFNANAGLWMFSAAPVLQSVVLDVNNNLADTVTASSILSDRPDSRKAKNIRTGDARI
jgi:hypothetical protein